MHPLLGLVHITRAEQVNGRGRPKGPLGRVRRSPSGFSEREVSTPLGPDDAVVLAGIERAAGPGRLPGAGHRFARTGERRGSSHTGDTSSEPRGDIVAAPGGSLPVRGSSLAPEFDSIPRI